jgi:hypothetical protein
MVKKTHTDGPWTATRNPGQEPTSWIVEKKATRSGGGMTALHVIAEIPAHSTRAESDARLISAAPELLDALVETLKTLETYCHTDEAESDVRDAAKVAIAKAKGMLK